MYARLGMNKMELEREICRMIPRVEKSSLAYNKAKIDSLRELIQENNIDYYKIVAEVETVLA